MQWNVPFPYRPPKACLVSRVFLVAVRQYGAWLCKYLVSARVNRCNGAVWPLSFPLMCELFTVITQETTDALTSPRATSILPVPTTGNNANSGRNSWKDKPLERS
ncbi:hypothetical protein AVEN_177190-1 [Araneus ventricosus]|uniref:Uncharacterized protein n=1 Tax=Araneus ventricosus TaxID=182803 RepID=A0A4Y2UAQ7_ARAVE|nr:hypothetical protein AVEN_177190-1 [Araneus ventricosus]